MISNSCAWGSIGLRRTTPLPRAANKLRHRPQIERSPLISRVLCRWSASTPTATQAIADAPKTIPGPSWLWLEPIYTPFRAYGRIQQRRPYATQFVSALVIYLVGDLVAQSIGPAKPTKRDIPRDGEASDKRGQLQSWIQDRDWERTARALLIGSISSIPSYRWFLWLGNSFNYSSKVLSLATKVTVNQLCFTPIFNSYFFGMQSLLTGADLPATVERIKNTVPTSWMNSCKVWPAITAFMFVYVPIQYRMIFGGSIAIGWQTYLSLLNQRAAAEEAALGGSDEVADTRKVVVKVEDVRREHSKEKCVAGG